MHQLISIVPHNLTTNTYYPENEDNLLFQNYTDPWVIANDVIPLNSLDDYVGGSPIGHLDLDFNTSLHENHPTNPSSSGPGTIEDNAHANFDSETLVSNSRDSPVPFEGSISEEPLGSSTFYRGSRFFGKLDIGVSENDTWIKQANGVLFGPEYYQNTAALPDSGSDIF